MEQVHGGVSRNVAEDAVEAVGEVLREFKTAGTQIRRRSQAKKFQIVIGECF